MDKITAQAHTDNNDSIRFIIGIAAGKGGVGKSTIAVNLARACARQGLRVGILDADIYGPSLRHMMPEDFPPSQSSSTERILPAKAGEIKLMSMAYFTSPDTATAVRAPFVNGVIGQFLKKVEWGPLDILFIDFPPGTGDIHLTIGQESRINGIVIVTTPQEVALLDVRKAIHMCSQIGVPILGILENMSYWIDPATKQQVPLLGQGGGQKLNSETGIPLLGEVPIEPLLTKAADLGLDIFNMDSTCYAAHVLKQASQKIIHDLIALEQMEGQYLKNFELIWQ